MTYLLDTNACIRYLSGRSVPLMQKLRTKPLNSIVICSVVKAELFYGAMKSQTPQLTLAKQLHFLNQFVSLPFDDVAAQIFGEIRAIWPAKAPPLVPMICKLRRLRWHTMSRW